MPARSVQRLVLIILALVGTAACSSPSPSPSAAASPTAEDLAWGATAQRHRNEEDGTQFTYECPPNGGVYAVAGTDVYTDDSSICVAAVHAGLITLAAGGEVTIEIRPGQTSYIGSSRNGIDSDAWGEWDGSFVFVTD